MENPQDRPDRRTTPRRPLHIAVIDDDRGPRIWVPQTITGTPNHPGPIPDAEIETFEKPLNDPSGYERFNGIIIDKMLGTFDGLKIAAEITQYDWTRPVLMLLTGLETAVLPMSNFEVVHFMLSKGDLLSQSNRFMWEMRRWARHMSQVRAAYERGYSDAMHST